MSSKVRQDQSTADVESSSAEAVAPEPTQAAQQAKAAREPAEPEAWVKATDVRPVEIGSRRWLVRRSVWYLYYVVCWLVFKTLYGWRAIDRSVMPQTEPFVMVCNHQTMLDPVIVGLAMPWREFGAIARRSLMKNAVARWVLLSLNSIPIDRGEADRKAMKDALTLLESGRPLLVFPEGTRSNDGKVKPFKPGILLIIRKAKVPVVPVAISGADRAWPAGRKLPKLFGRVRIKFGQPISPEALSQDRVEAVKQLHDAVVRLHAELEAENV